LKFLILRKSFIFRIFGLFFWEILFDFFINTFCKVFEISFLCGIYIAECNIHLFNKCRCNLSKSICNQNNFQFQFQLGCQFSHNISRLGFPIILKHVIRASHCPISFQFCHKVFLSWVDKDAVFFNGCKLLYNVGYFQAYC